MSKILVTELVLPAGPPGDITPAAEAARDAAQGAASRAETAASGISADVSDLRDEVTVTYSPAFADTSVSYDAAGKVNSVVEGGITTTFTYNANGTVATDNRLGKTRNFIYDTAGRLVTIAVGATDPTPPDSGTPTNPDPSTPSGGFDNGYDTGY